MRNPILSLCAGALLASAALPTLTGCVAAQASERGATATAERPVRIGTYDNRAIAVAYAPSRFNPVREKMEEHEQAKAAGDEARVAELEAWGEAAQRALHRQGFARVPVDDLLAHVADGIAALARERDLDAVVPSCDYTGPRVEVLDVTDDLVRLFDPSPTTLKSAAEIRRQAPVDLDEVERGHGR